MLRFATKLLFLFAFLVLTWSFYGPSDASGAWTASICMLVLGLASLCPQAVLEGRGEAPGILPGLTVILLVAPICFFHLLPGELYELGVSTRVPDNSVPHMVVTVLTGIVLAFYIWIPFIAYHVIDMGFRCFEKPSSTRAA